MDKEIINSLSTSVIAFSTVIGVIAGLIFYFKEDVSPSLLISIVGVYLFSVLLLLSYVVEVIK
jgi:hypothetical protein